MMAKSQILVEKHVLHLAEKVAKFHENAPKVDKNMNFSTAEECNRWSDDNLIELQSLLRKSDFLLEANNTYYYTL